ncbi:hypothetical protein Bca4012_036721 [Brassica carinata]
MRLRRKVVQTEGRSWVPPAPFQALTSRRRKTRHPGEPNGGVGRRNDILEKGGDNVKSAWPLWAGPHTCYNGNYNGKQGCKAERIRKDCLSSIVLCNSGT